MLHMATAGLGPAVENVGMPLIKNGFQENRRG